MMYGYPDDYRTRYNSLVLSDKELDGIDTLENALQRALTLLMDAGYECIVRREELGIIAIEYNYDRHENFGTPVAYWLSEEDEEEMGTRPDVWIAVKESDCEAHYFFDENNARKYLGSETGYVEKVDFDDD